MQHGRNNAARAVGRRGDNSSSGGVLFVDRHGVQVDPLHCGKAASGVFLLFQQAVVNLGRSAGHVEPAGQDAGGGNAGGDALAHGVPDEIEVLVDEAAPALAGVEEFLIGQHDLPNGLVVLLAQREEFVASGETEGHRLLHLGGGRAGRDLVGGLHLGIELLARQDEAASDGEVFRALGQHIAVGVPRREDETVRVLGHRLVVELDGVLQLAGGTRGMPLGGNGSGLRLRVQRHGQWVPPDEAEYDGSVSGMPLAGSR